MEKTVIRTENAPAPFQGAPYNQAIRVGELVFVAGQLGLKPGDTAVEGDVATQTDQALRNLSAILEAAGSSLEKLVRLALSRTIPSRVASHSFAPFQMLISSTSESTTRSVFVAGR